MFDNDAVDGSFGITSKIFLDRVLPMSGAYLGSLEVPSGGASGSGDHLVTSLSSKSELALNLSTDGQDLTFMGTWRRRARWTSRIPIRRGSSIRRIRTRAYDRAVAEVDRAGRFHFTETNAYSGNNGRPAILNSQVNVLYTAGNAGNGSTPQPKGIVLGAGAQIMAPAIVPEVAQTPGDPTPVGNFNITELGLPPGKIGKDDNFRGLTVSENVVYYTKGSGGNGLNTVYFVDTTGRACPNGSGLPVPGAALPTSSTLSYVNNTTVGLAPNNMCILKSFPTVLASAPSSTFFPFGLWFADSRTVYVAAEGNGAIGPVTGGQYSTAAAQPTAGLEKWVLRGGTWTLAYTLQGGLSLGQPYTVAAIRPEITRRPGFRGRRRPTGCATSPAGSTRSGGPRRSGGSPPR